MPTSLEQTISLEESMDQISDFVKGGIDSFIASNSEIKLERRILATVSLIMSLGQEQLLLL
jgi:hypothetical protein